MTSTSLEKIEKLGLLKILMWALALIQLAIFSWGKIITTKTFETEQKVAVHEAVINRVETKVDNLDKKMDQMILLVK